MLRLLSLPQDGCLVSVRIADPGPLRAVLAFAVVCLVIGAGLPLGVASMLHVLALRGGSCPSIGRFMSFAKGKRTPLREPVSRPLAASPPAFASPPVASEPTQLSPPDAASAATSALEAVRPTALPSRPATAVCPFIVSMAPPRPTLTLQELLTDYPIGGKARHSRPALTLAELLSHYPIADHTEPRECPGAGAAVTTSTEAMALTKPK